MTANKMPEMPEWDTSCMECGWSLPEKGIADYGRACYLAGIAAARECVPAEATSATNQIDRFGQGQFNRCRKTTLTNLTALEQEAKK